MRSYLLATSMAVLVGLNGCALNGTNFTAEIRTSVYAYGFFYKRIFDKFHGNDPDDFDTSTDYSALCAAVEGETFALPPGCVIDSGCDGGDDKKTVEIVCQGAVDNGEGKPGMHDSGEICGDREGLQAMPTNRMILGFEPDDVTRSIKIKFDGDIWFLWDLLDKLWIDVDYRLTVAADNTVSVDCDYEDFKFELETGNGTMIMETKTCDEVGSYIESFINSGGTCPTTE